MNSQLTLMEIYFTIKIFELKYTIKTYLTKLKCSLGIITLGKLCLEQGFLQAGKSLILFRIA